MLSSCHVEVHISKPEVSSKIAYDVDSLLARMGERKNGPPRFCPNNPSSLQEGNEHRSSILSHVFELSFEDMRDRMFETHARANKHPQANPRSPPAQKLEGRPRSPTLAGGSGADRRRARARARARAKYKTTNYIHLNS